ncbi:lipopolysaccharide biosynthesis protein [Streptomyces odontomachi]|uniref:lipopolysaccharide biosynthesis protein n=1 Tax=Streptomyces odontomachi TaxID=2944940 RepID=UPI00210C07DE|nr:lipopolysaccharide biosynthesis protein [Streptomyces sp. ODS25]
MPRTPSRRRNTTAARVRTPAPAPAPARAPEPVPHPPGPEPAGAPEQRWWRARRWLPWLALPVCLAVGSLTGGTYGALRTPQYTATAYVIVVPEGKSEPSTALGFAQTYGRTATQLAVLGDAPVWAGVPVRTLRASVRAETSPDAPMIALTASSPLPDRAADMANAVSRALIINANVTHRDTHVRVVQFSRAIPPTEPASPSALVTALVGACAGGLLGGLALLVRHPERPRSTAGGAPVPGPATSADVRGRR